MTFLIYQNLITHKGKVYLSFWVWLKIRFVKFWHLVFYSNLHNMILRRKKEQDQVLLIVHMSPVLWLDKNPLRGQVDALRDEKTLLFRIFCCYYFIQLHLLFIFYVKAFLHWWWRKELWAVIYVALNITLKITTQ